MKKYLIVVLLSVSTFAHADQCDYKSVVTLANNASWGYEDQRYLSGLMAEAGFTNNPDSENTAYITITSHERLLSTINPLRLGSELLHSLAGILEGGGWFNIAVNNVRQSVNVSSANNETIAKFKKTFLGTSIGDRNYGMWVGDNSSKTPVQILEKNCDTN